MFGIQETNPDLLVVKAYDARRASQYERERSCHERLNKSSPHIMDPVDMFEYDGWRLVILPCIYGVSGAQLTNRLSTNDAVAKRLLIGVAKALETAHGKNITHGDVSLGNTMVSAHLGYLIDWGLGGGKELGPVDAGNGTISGTVGFIAPEIIAGEQPYRTVETDSYGLGALAYALFTGEVPGEADTPQMMLKRALDHSFDELEKRRPDLPAPLCDVVERALSEISEVRPSANEFVRVLERY